MRVLFVCHGNICRSPMAEFILKALVRSRGLEGAWHIESAAVSTEEIGNPIYPPAKRCLSQHGVPFDKEKRARQVTRADYDRFDRIICMDAWNLRRRPGRRGPVVYGGFRNNLPRYPGRL